MFRWFLAGNGDDPRDLLRRERGGTTGARSIGQQSANGFAQEFGVVLQTIQRSAACEPTLSPYAYRVLTQIQFLGDGFVGESFVDPEYDLGPLDQSMRDFAAVGNDIKKSLLFGRQANRSGRAGHGVRGIVCKKGYYPNYFSGGVLGYLLAAGSGCPGCRRGR